MDALLRIFLSRQAREIHKALDSLSSDAELREICAIIVLVAIQANEETRSRLPAFLRARIRQGQASGQAPLVEVMAREVAHFASRRGLRLPALLNEAHLRRVGVVLRDALRQLAEQDPALLHDMATVNRLVDYVYLEAQKQLQ